MRDAAILLVGVIAGGLMNLWVQLGVERRRRRRSLRLAARVIYSELSEYGNLEINDGPLDASHLHEAWREHRSALIDLGAEEWSAIEAAVENALYPQVYPQKPSSAPNDSLEKALSLLEPHADLPEGLRGFE
jgi:type II secretory pathway pseudopilin PulG